MGILTFLNKVLAIMYFFDNLLKQYLNSYGNINNQYAR